MEPCYPRYAFRGRINDWFGDTNDERSLSNVLTPHLANECKQALLFSTFAFADSDLENLAGFTSKYSGAYQTYRGTLRLNLGWLFEAIWSCYFAHCQSFALIAARQKLKWYDLCN